MRSVGLCLLTILLVAALAAADEIRLKDGTKIIGTIVGFDDGSFKVQTSYGFAMVRKDKIAAIIPSEVKPEAKKDTADTRKPVITAEPRAAQPAAKPAPVEAKSVSATVEPPRAPEKAFPAAAQPPAVKPAPPAPTAAAKAASAPAKAAVAPPQPAPAPVPSAPPPIRDEVLGNVYINHTYGFSIYKPPSWHTIEGAQKALPAAVAAMGTSDETTLFIIGRESLKESLEAHAATTERQLREVYENYRRISEQRARVAGLPALERRYRGTADGHDWSGVVLSVARGNEIFTILGMTYADSDLIQIQENVIAKTIASLEFTPR